MFRVVVNTVWSYHYVVRGKDGSRRGRTNDSTGHTNGSTGHTSGSTVHTNYSTGRSNYSTGRSKGGLGVEIISHIMASLVLVCFLLCVGLNAGH